MGKRALFLVFILFLGSQSLAYAQSTKKPAKSVKPGDPSVVQSQTYLKEIDKTLGRGYSLLMKAGKEKDILKIDCLKEKYSVMQGVREVIQASIKSLQEYLSKNNDSLAKHEFSKISLLYNKVKSYAIEIEGCLGETASYIGRTAITTDVDPLVEKIKATEIAPVVEISRPQDASRY